MGHNLTYTLSDTDASAFTLIGNVLAINESLDFSIRSSYRIVINATGSFGTSNSREITINVIEQ